MEKQKTKRVYKTIGQRANVYEGEYKNAFTFRRRIQHVIVVQRAEIK